MLATCWHCDKQTVRSQGCTELTADTLEEDLRILVKKMLLFSPVRLDFYDEACYDFSK